MRKILGKYALNVMDSGCVPNVWEQDSVWYAMVALICIALIVEIQVNVLIVKARANVLAVKAKEQINFLTNDL